MPRSPRASLAALLSEHGELVTAGLGELTSCRRRSRLQYASVSEHLPSATCSKWLRCSCSSFFACFLVCYIPLDNFAVPIFHGARSQCAPPQLQEWAAIVIQIIHIAASCVFTSLFDSAAAHSSPFPQLVQLFLRARPALPH